MSSLAFYQKTLELLKKNQAFILASIVEKNGSAPRELGAKMLIIQDQGGFSTHATIGGGNIEFRAIEDAKKMLQAQSQEPQIHEYHLDEEHGQRCGGSAKVLLEPFGGQKEFYIFGAGHVGIEIARVLEGINMHVHLIDEREEWINSPLIPQSTIRHHIMWDQFLKETSLKGNAMVAIMSFDHHHDKDILEAVLKGHLFSFLGLMGSKGKWLSFQKELKSDGFTEHDLAKVTCPIGDKAVGKGPREIAISIANQILKLR